MRLLLSLEPADDSDALSCEFEFTKDVIRIGRDSDNDVVLSRHDCDRVSRHHAELRSVDGTWRIVDANSANGTFLNFRRVATSSVSRGDTIRLGENGPTLRILLLEVEAALAPPTVSTVVRNHFAVALPGDDPTPSQLLPLRSGLKLFKANGMLYLIPGLLTVLSMILFMALSLAGEQYWAIKVLHVYLTAASFFAVYLMCGRSRPWWLFVGVAGASAIFAPLVVDILRIVPFALMPASWEPLKLHLQRSIPVEFVYMLAMAGLPEELAKILPVLVGLRRGLQNRVTRIWTVKEPLDGILLGVASASGFTLVEGLQYAVRLHDESVDAGDPGSGMFLAFFSIIFRSISNILTHGAYSGIFGYYVGLAAIQPQHKRILLLRGLATAALLHATWNTFGSIPVIGLFIAGVSYLGLATCILQARKVSPDLAGNVLAVAGRV